MATVTPSTFIDSGVMLLVLKNQIHAVFTSIPVGHQTVDTTFFAEPLSRSIYCRVYNTEKL